jgi:ribose transport system substrate-binding protein
VVIRTVRPIIAALLLSMGMAVGGCDRSGGSGSTAATTKAARPRVAYVTNGVDSFWQIADAGAKAGGEMYNADVEVQMPSGGVADQQRIVEDLLTRGVEGIAISPIDAENETPLIN